MRKEIAEKWAAALRSGEYEQTQTVLANKERTKHCCLGVLCEVAIKEGVDVEVHAALGSTYFDGWASTLPVSVMDWADMRSEAGMMITDSLAELNDEGRTFSDIAAVIEEHQEIL